jgi:hypothetical protein
MNNNAADATGGPASLKLQNRIFVITGPRLRSLAFFPGADMSNSPDILLVRLRSASTVRLKIERAATLARPGGSG